MSASVGNLAPPLALKDQDGNPFSLESLRGDRVAVVFFYPKDFTPGCTAESCAFRDSHEAFADAGAVVVGVSSDGQASHRRFADAYSLPYTLVSDGAGEVRRAWGVRKSLGVFPGRVTFVVDKGGIVRHEFSSQLQAAKHVAEALKVVRSLAVET
ncbi:MAG: peroxiredoxin [Myxococcota bacterium]